MNQPRTQCLDWRKHHAWYMGVCQFCGAIQRDARKAQLRTKKRTEENTHGRLHIPE